MILEGVSGLILYSVLSYKNKPAIFNSKYEIFKATFLLVSSTHLRGQRSIWLAKFKAIYQLLGYQLILFTIHFDPIFFFGAEYSKTRL